MAIFFAANEAPAFAAGEYCFARNAVDLQRTCIRYASYLAWPSVHAEVNTPEGLIACAYSLSTERTIMSSAGPELTMYLEHDRFASACPMAIADARIGFCSTRFSSWAHP